MCRKIKVILPGGTVKECDIGSCILEILGTGKKPGEPLVALVDGEAEDLTKRIHFSVKIEPINITNSLGVRTYVRSLTFLLIKAVEEVLQGARVTIEHSLGKGLYGEIHFSRSVTSEDIDSIKSKMREIVDKDYPIERIKIKKEDAMKIFENYGMMDKMRLIKHIKLSYINLYKCEDLYDYFYGPMVPSMGYLSVFELFKYENGFILMYPHEEDPVKLPEFKNLPKLAKVFKETERWARILDVADVGALNDKVDSGEIEDLILVSDALHEKKIAQIADKIFENKDKIKIVLIAGPSSSGKTTFSKRLSIQLRVLGLKPHAISLDDYFVNREMTPKNEKGELDFESIRALDLELFNQHLASLLKNEEIKLPKFDFIKGERVWTDKNYLMEQDSILVIEGIHGLNEMLTNLIPRENKYKIYVSALTQLNIDDHNRIPTTDVRLLRRIVRDNMSRGRNAEATLLAWPQVRAGEEINIFPFQEDADTMFNSTLIYEMSILKKYAEPLLKEIEVTSPAYIEANRLLIFLGYFKEAGEYHIPYNSIIREFIGGSCFKL